MAAEQRGKFKASSYDYDAVLMQMKGLEGELKSKDKQIENLRELVKQQEQQIGESAEAATLRAELQMKRQQLESAEVKVRTTTQGIEIAQKEVEAVKRQCDADKKRIAEQLNEANAQNATLAGEAGALRADLQAARLREKELKSLSETLNKQVEILTAKLTAQDSLSSSFKLLEAENFELKKEIDSYSSRLQLSQRSETDTVSKLKELADENSRLREITSSNQDMMGSHQIKLIKLHEDLEGHARQTSVLKKQVEDCEVSKAELIKKLKDLSSALDAKIKEVEALKAQIQDMKDRAIVDFKIVLGVDEPVVHVQEHELQVLRLRCSHLELKAAENEGKLRDSWRERGFLQEQLRQSEAREHARDEEYKRGMSEFKLKLIDMERQCKEWKDQYFELEGQMEEREEAIQDLENKLEEEVSHNHEQDRLMREVCLQNQEMEKAVRTLRSELVGLNSEKDQLERRAREQGGKIKGLSEAIGKLEAELAQKKQQLERQESLNANQSKQIDILSKKLSQAQGSLKQNYSTKLKQASDKLASYEQEISMLKDMIKSTQLMHNRKKQTSKYSPPLPVVQERYMTFKKEKDFSPDVRMQGYRSPDIEELSTQEHKTPDYKSPVYRTPDYRDHASPIIKSLKVSNSPFKIASPIKQVTHEAKRKGRAPSLSSIVRGYLTSVILCEKERIELLEKCKRADSSGLNYLPKSTLVQLFEGEIVDVSALESAEESVNYKEFLAQNCQSQIEGLKQELELHFANYDQPTVSLSELRLMSNTLRPLQQKVWQAILERLRLANYQEVSVNELREQLCQLSVSLG
mmetsp:Transcript_7740/g.14681  ORF Transcript_7740/g.14681 Transcript_7740/m.14681 type:complete len:807 (-) Transcript_7740:3621-6041(-)